jgi:single-strand DNA-binding protein
MSSFNKVILMGNLTRDPQVKQLPSNTTVADFGLAVNRRYKTQAGEDREETLFVDCAAFGKQADVISQYCKKGKALFVEGRLKLDTWEDKMGGGHRSKITVVVENFQFVGGRDGSGSFEGAAAGQDAREERKGSPDAQQQSKANGRKRSGEQLKFKEADIPF